MRWRSPAGSSFLIAAVATGVAAGAEPAGPSLEQRFQDVVRPFLKSQCLECHGAQKAEGEARPERLHFALIGHQELPRVGSRVRIVSRPTKCRPEDAPRRPTAHERAPSSTGSRPCWTTRPAKRGRSRAGARPAALERRVRLHDPRLDRASISAPPASFPSIPPTRPALTTRANR